MKASEFSGLIPECSSEVLDAMYFVAVLGSESLERMPEVPPSPDTSLAFGLQFAGDVSGRFGLCLEQSTAQNLAVNFLGENEFEISSSEVAEVVGELANMLCGSVMSRIEGKHKFILSHPEATDAPLLADADDVLVSRLDTDSGFITVWIVVERNV